MRLHSFVFFLAVSLCLSSALSAAETQTTEINIPISSHLDNLKRDLSLDNEQVQKINAIMSESYPELSPSLKIPDEERIQKIREHNKAAAERVKEVLTPAQQELYTKLLDKKKQMYATALNQSRVDDMAKAVGLTKKQKDAITKIMNDYKQQARSASNLPISEDINDEKAASINKIRKERDAKIEAQLSAAQIKKYKAFLKAGKSIPNYKIN